MSAAGHRWQLSGLIAIAIGTRWLFCFVLFPDFLVRFASVGEQYAVDGYLEIAEQLWAGNGYRTGPGAVPVLHRPPGYLPVLLLSFPGSERAHLVFQLLHGLLGGVATWLTWKMCRLWGASKRSSLLAGCTVALWPFLIWETKVTVPENLLVVLVPATFTAVGVWYRDRRTRWLLLASLLAGWASLTHGAYLAFVIGFIYTVLTREHSWPRRLRGAGLALGVVVTLMAPWVVRNHHLAGRFVGVATGFGLHYWVGNYYYDLLLRGEGYFRDNGLAAFEWISRMLDNAGFEDVDLATLRDDSEINRYLAGRAKEDLLRRPGFQLAKTIIKMPLAWIRQQSGSRSMLNALLDAPLFVLAAIGLWRRLDFARSGLLVSMLAVNAGFAAVYAEAMPMRYVLPLLPLLLFWAALGFDSLVGPLVPRRLVIR